MLGEQLHVEWAHNPERSPRETKPQIEALPSQEKYHDDDDSDDDDDDIIFDDGDIIFDDDDMLVDDHDGHQVYSPSQSRWCCRLAPWSTLNDPELGQKMEKKSLEQNPFALFLLEQTYIFYDAELKNERNMRQK